ncbi:hypothetical protein M758_4G038000 [Ceratodon purpureus]|nr:hypothetical protein M758_4G038000 [Ceratodon purpureus]
MSSHLPDEPHSPEKPTGGEGPRQVVILGHPPQPSYDDPVTIQPHTLHTIIPTTSTQPRLRNHSPLTNALMQILRARGIAAPLRQRIKAPDLHCSSGPTAPSAGCSPLLGCCRAQPTSRKRIHYFAPVSLLYHTHPRPPRPIHTIADGGLEYQ